MAQGTDTFYKITVSEIEAEGNKGLFETLCEKTDFTQIYTLKVPKCEIFDRSDFHYFYTIKPFWVDDFVVIIFTYYFNFWGCQASFSF